MANSNSLLNNLQANNVQANNVHTNNLIISNANSEEKNIKNIVENILEVGVYKTKNKTLFIYHNNNYNNFIKMYYINSDQNTLTIAGYNYNEKNKIVIGAEEIVETNNIKSKREITLDTFNNNEIKGNFKGYNHISNKLHTNGTVIITKIINGFNVKVYDEDNVSISDNNYIKD